MAYSRAALLYCAMVIGCFQVHANIDDSFDLPDDDECQADASSGSNGCALSALQLHAANMGEQANFEEDASYDSDEAEDADFESEAQEDGEEDGQEDGQEDADYVVAVDEDVDEDLQLLAEQAEDALDQEGLNILAMVNSAISKKLGGINAKIGGMLRAKHLDPLNMGNKGKTVKLSSLRGISSMHLNSMKATKIAKTNHGVKIIMTLRGSFTKSMVASGHLEHGRMHPPISITMKGISFSSPVTAYVNPKAKTITKFAVGSTHVNINSISGYAQARFFARIINRKLNQKLPAKKGAIAGKIASKLGPALSKALNKKCPMHLKMR